MKTIWKIFQHKEISIQDQWNSLSDGETSIVKIEICGNYPTEGEAEQGAIAVLGTDPDYILSVEKVMIHDTNHPDMIGFLF